MVLIKTMMLIFIQKFFVDKKKYWPESLFYWCGLLGPLRAQRKMQHIDCALLYELCAFHHFAHSFEPCLSLEYSSNNTQHK